MKHFNHTLSLITSLLLLVAATLLPGLLAGQDTKKPDGNVPGDYRLIWSDDFNSGGKPNASKWVAEIGTGDNGWGNQELQYYTARPENVTCKAGNLVITARKEAYEGSAYTSSRIKTKGKFTFCYGKIEFRAKLPGGTGIWPALWLLGDNIETASWPACGEIDVMEYAGKNKDLIHGSIHTPSSFGGTINTKTITIPGVEDGFHIYSVEWTEKEIIYRIDGEHFYTYKPKEYNDDTWPFNKPFFIIINVAVGGGFGGPVDPGIFPASMSVDYVKVYQIKGKD